MSNFIQVFLTFFTGLFTVEIFLYFVAAFAFISVVFLLFKFIYG